MKNSFHFELNPNQGSPYCADVASPSSLLSVSSGSAAPGVINGAGRGAAVVAFEESVVGFFVDAADLLGVPKSVAIIYGTLFASSQALSFSDIEHHVNLSKGSVGSRIGVNARPDHRQGV